MRCDQPLAAEGESSDSIGTMGLLGAVDKAKQAQLNGGSNTAPAAGGAAAAGHKEVAVTITAPS